MKLTLAGAGTQESAEAQVDETEQALRVQARPLDSFTAGLLGGHYALALTFTNTVASFAAGAQALSVRWAAPSHFMVLKRLTASAETITAFTTAQAIAVDAICARNFSVGASGGTAIVPGTADFKKSRRNMRTTLFASSGTIQVSSGAALTAGTQTLDNQPFGYATLLASTAIGTLGQNAVLFQQIDLGTHAMMFEANEGFVIRNVIAAGALGVVRFRFLMEWAEVAAY